MTTITIITPLHNKSPFVAETLASVQGQTFNDWELIVVENHSRYDGPAQVERIAADDQRCNSFQSLESHPRLPIAHPSLTA